MTDKPEPLTDAEVEELEEYVRSMIFDLAPRNNLTRRIIFDKDDVRKAALKAYDHFNDRPPAGVRASTYAGVPRRILGLGTTYALLRGRSINAALNHVGIPTDDDEIIEMDAMGQVLASMAADVRGDLDTAIDDYKIPINLSSAYGSMGSGYSYTDPWRY